MSSAKNNLLRRADDEKPNLAKDIEAQEQRGAHRFDFNVPCAIRLEDSLVLYGQIKDISLSGSFIKIRHYDNESVVNQRALLHWEGRLEGKDISATIACCIVRATRNGVGVTFRMSEKTRVSEMITLIENAEQIFVAPSSDIDDDEETNDSNEGFILANRRRDDFQYEMDEDFIFFQIPFKDKF